MLSDHYDPPYLDPGWHDVTVLEHRCFSAKSGNPGVEFTLANDEGKRAKVTFWLTQKAMFRLAVFAKCCGLSKEEAGRYDEGAESSHTVLHRKRLSALVIRGEGGYAEVDDYQPLGENQPTVTETDERRSYDAQTGPVTATPTGDNVPF